MITGMIISAFAQQSHITVTGRGRAGSESGIKIMKKRGKSKVHVLVFKICHQVPFGTLEDTLPRRFGALPHSSSCHDVLLKPRSRSESGKVSGSSQQFTRSTGAAAASQYGTVKSIYDSDSKALLHASQKCFPLSCHLPVPTASGKSHLKSPFFCPSTPLPCHLLPQETTLTHIATDNDKGPL